MTDALSLSLQKLQSFYSKGATLDYHFRRDQLKKLKASVLAYEKPLLEALDADLKKNPEESWVTEIGFLIAEINHTLKHLKQWMRPERVRTNLVNFPSASKIYREPLGVVLIVGPWNYPLQLLFTPLVGAIAAGNCVVVKPSEYAPATAAVMEQIITTAFPPEYILLKQGNGAELIPAMFDRFRFQHVFYTGSIPVGRSVYELAARQLIPVTLELGGKSPCVVEEDADLKVAARRIAVTKFSNAGQMCVAPDYLLVQAAVKERFTNLLIQTIQEFYSEDSSMSYNYGRIINERQYQRLVKYLEQGRIIYGGRHDAHRLFLEPTLIEELPLQSAIMGEEIFGPILPIITFTSFEEAKGIIGLNPEPLAFYLFTQSAGKEHQYITSLPFGGGCINNASWHLTNFHLPFGGRGHSGIGAYHGKYSFDVFSHPKSIMKTPTWFDPAFKYPPFEGKLKWFKKIVK